MSCELVFIAHHKNRAVCVAARALQHDHHATESIMGNCYCAGERGGKREQEVEEDKGGGEGVLVSSLLISPHIPGFRAMM